MTGTSREAYDIPWRAIPGSMSAVATTTRNSSRHPLAEIDDPPAHDAMHGRDRAPLEYRGERGAVRAVQTRPLSGRLAINQPFRSMGVELHHPIANDLERHPADLRRLGPARAFVNCRQRQQPPGLRPIGFDRLAEALTICASKSARSGMGMANTPAARHNLGSDTRRFTRSPHRGHAYRASVSYAKSAAGRCNAFSWSGWWLPMSPLFCLDLFGFACVYLALIRLPVASAAARGEPRWQGVRLGAVLLAEARGLDRKVSLVLEARVLARGHRGKPPRRSRGRRPRPSPPPIWRNRSGHSYRRAPCRRDGRCRSAPACSQRPHGR